MSRGSPIRFNVAPRYTCGSPAQVHEGIAVRVAKQEAEAYRDHYLSGLYGADAKAEAEKNGLDFIAFTMRETRKGWEAYDLLTGKLWLLPYNATCPKCGEKKVDCNRGKLRQHYSRSFGEHCPKIGAFLGVEQRDAEHRIERYGTEVIG